MISKRLIAACITQKVNGQYALLEKNFEVKRTSHINYDDSNTIVYIVTVNDDILKLLPGAFDKEYILTTEDILSLMFEMYEQNL
jgi:hypothetical protein